MFEKVSLFLPFPQELDLSFQPSLVKGDRPREQEVEEMEKKSAIWSR